MVPVVRRIEDVEVYKFGEVGFSALGDRVVVLEDIFRSGYECSTCNGTGKICCANCNGSGKSSVNTHAKCSQCHGDTYQTCDTCQGKGGLLVIPDSSKRRPTTGQIVSAGEGCKVLKHGECVMYSNFAGFAIDLNRAGEDIVLRVLHETEVMCRVSGHLELRTLRNTAEVSSI